MGGDFPHTLKPGKIICGNTKIWAHPVSGIHELASLSDLGSYPSVSVVQSMIDTSIDNLKLKDTISIVGSYSGKPTSNNMTLATANWKYANPSTFTRIKVILTNSPNNLFITNQPGANWQFSTSGARDVASDYSVTLQLSTTSSLNRRLYRASITSPYNSDETVFAEVYIYASASANSSLGIQLTSLRYPVISLGTIAITAYGYVD